MDSQAKTAETSDSTNLSGTESQPDWVVGWLAIHQEIGTLWTALLQKNAQASQDSLLRIQTESRLLSNTIKLIQENDYAKNVFR